MKLGFVQRIGIKVIVVAAIFLVAGVAKAQGNAPATYKAKCAACHGAGGKGGPAGKALGVHDFASPETQNMSDSDLAAIIAQGKNKMPAYGGSLKEPEIKDLVQYVRALGKKK
jgi:mono/diheme cytochrome c family protein